MSKIAKMIEKSRKKSHILLTYILYPKCINIKNMARFARTNEAIFGFFVSMPGFRDFYTLLVLMNIFGIDAQKSSSSTFLSDFQKPTKNLQ